MVIVVLAATISHVVLSVTVPLLWIALLVVAVLFATGTSGTPARAKTARQPPAGKDIMHPMFKELFIEA